MSRCLTSLLLSALLGGLLCPVAGLLSPAVLRAQTEDPAPCSGPEDRQFDFWLGEWEVLVDEKVVGYNRISRIQGGCTLLEEYDTLPDPYAGMSFNYYDPSDGFWHQVWVDSAGTRLHLSGGFADDRMVLAGDRETGEGPTSDRITWTDNRDGTVRQQWDVSADAGATWTNVFDGLYQSLTGGSEGESQTDPAAR